MPDGRTAGEPAPRSEFGQYLDRLKSENVQGWARDSARSSRKGWKGSGEGKAGWGPGGGGTGTGYGTGTGSGAAGQGVGQGGGGGYLDPRVRMVVNSFPHTSIENRYTAVAYPDLKIKKAQYASGWWNVYIEIHTDASGNVARYQVLRPETDGPLERIFLGQVKREVANWKFDPVAAEIHIDVRFYVE
jgi:hypothetical protein